MYVRYVMYFLIEMRFSVKVHFGCVLLFVYPLHLSFGVVLSTSTLNNLLHVGLLWFCSSYSLAVPLAVILFTTGNRFIDTCCDVQPGGREYL